MHALPRLTIVRLIVPVFAAILIIATTAGSAVAQDDDGFTSIVSAGMKAYNEGDFDTAIERFFEAKLVRDEPELVYNIARAYHKDGKCIPATKHYNQFLNRGDAPDELVAKTGGYLEELGECPTTGMLALTCLPQDAQVTVDGRPVGTCGEFELEGGDHALIVSAEGYKPTDRQVTVEPGETTSTAITLEVFQASGGGGGGQVDSGGFNWLGLSLVVGGAALVGSVFIVDAVNQENIDELDKLPKGDPARGSFEDALTGNQAVMWALGSIGVATIVTGSVLWALGIGESGGGSESGSADAIDWQVTPAVGVDNVGGAVHVRF